MVGRESFPDLDLDDSLRLVRGRAAACLEACSTGLEVGGVHRGERPS